MEAVPMRFPLSFTYAQFVHRRRMEKAKRTAASDRADA